MCDHGFVEALKAQRKTDVTTDVDIIPESDYRAQLQYVTLVSVNQFIFLHFCLNFRARKTGSQFSNTVQVEKEIGKSLTVLVKGLITHTHY